jgi:hypothetical protein
MAVLLQLVERKHKGVSGIYKITIGEYYYYGSSTDVYRRKYQHQQELRASKHKNKFMQKVFEKYGEPTYEFVMGCDRDDLIDLEQQFLDEHHGKEFCMNISNDAVCPRNRIFTDESKQKIRIALMGNTNGSGGRGVKRNFTEEGIKNRLTGLRNKLNKKVVVITTTGQKIEFDSRLAASKELNVPTKTISNWVLGISKPTIHKDYIGWVFSQGD